MGRQVSSDQFEQVSAGFIFRVEVLLARLQPRSGVVVGPATCPKRKDVSLAGVTALRSIGV